MNPTAFLYYSSISVNYLNAIYPQSGVSMTESCLSLADVSSCASTPLYASRIQDNAVQDNCQPSLMIEFAVNHTELYGVIGIVITSYKTRAGKTHVMHDF